MANKELVIKYRGAGNPQVFEKNIASIKQIGSDVPAALDLSSNRGLAVNRVCNFEGDRYAVQDYKVHKLSASGTWDLDFTPSVTVGSSYEGVVGLYPALIGDEPYLYYIWRGATNATRMSRKSSKFVGAGAWESEISYTHSTFASNLVVSDAIQVGNVVYCCYGGSNVNNAAQVGNFIIADLSTNTIGRVIKPARNADTPAGANLTFVNPVFTGWNRKVYATYYRGKDNTGARLMSSELIEIQGSLTSAAAVLSYIDENDATQIVVDMSDDDNGGHRPALFTDETDLFAIVWESGHTVAAETSDDNAYDGWSAKRVIASGGALVVEDITNAVLPVALRRDDGLGGGGAKFGGRWSTNTQVDGSGNFTTQLIYTDNGSAASQSIIYNWVDKDTQIELIDVGTNPSLSVAHYYRGGGNYESVKVQTNIEDIRESTSIAGDVEIDIRFIGSGQAISFGIYYDYDKEVVNDFATLRSSTSGTVSGDGKTVSGITVGSGNLITLSWKAEADNIPNGINAGINPVIYLV